MERLRETFVALTSVYGRGRVQIPKKIRKKLQLKDGDKVLWIEVGGRFYIRKAEIPQLFRLTDSGRTEELKKREG